MYTLRSPLFRGAVSIAILAALLQVGARHTGPAPPLGPLLDPANGVWAVATVVDFRAEETLELPGMLDSVHVLFDDRSVPHIFASNSEDAARALGYVVARDRLFQMEMRWRTTAGRISELVGDRALSFDRYLRRLALAWSANRTFDKLDRESQVFREAMAYSEGVNAWIDGMRRRDVPLEYRLLGARPSRWEPVYSFYLAKLLGWDLSYGFASDLRRLRARARVGREATDALFPINNPIQQPIQPNGSTGPRFDFAPIPPPGEPDLAAARLERELDPPLAFEPLLDLEGRLGREALGSNNWAVSPGRSAGGHALVAGDPHLGLNLPSIWYEVHMSVAGDFDVYGVTIPSVPFVVIGFNRDVAWSFTNTGADVIDYYEEELDDPERPTRYLVDGEWRPLERRIEEHRDRKGRLLAADTIYFTHRGPIVTDAGRRLSMRWTVLESGSDAKAFPSIARAATVADWLRAMELSEAPAQNGIVADRAGSIAIRSSGLFPLHPDGSGLPVRDGGNSSSDWIGFWPVERYPFALNPEQGYLASANQQPIDPGLDPAYLGANWPSPWRAIRINQLLAGDAAVTPDAMRRYQTDPGSARADYFLPFFLEAGGGSNSAGGEGSPPPLRADAREAARRLAEWDASYTKDNERAVLFEYAMDELAERTWDELRTDLELDGIGRSPTPGSAILASLLTQPENPWWDDRRTAEVEDRDAILVASLAAALERALAEHGEPDSGGWRWDEIRHLNIDHLMGLGPLSARSLPIQGGPGTLNPAFGRGTFGASWRMVVELGPELRAWTIYPGGQSGNPFSPRYDDRMSKWIDGELDTVRFPRAASELDPAGVSSSLILIPAR